MQLGQYKVGFHHEDNSKKKDHYVRVSVINPETLVSLDIDLLVEAPASFTECKIYSEVEGEAINNLNAIKLSEREDRYYVIVGTGIAKLHKGDIYNKETGRRLSLSRALQDMDISKDERAEIWEAYRTTGLEGRVRWGVKPKTEAIKNTEEIVGDN